MLNSLNATTIGDETANVEAGMVTTEYALGTCAAGGLGGILISLLTSDWMQGILKNVFQGIFGKWF